MNSSSNISISTDSSNFPILSQSDNHIMVTEIEYEYINYIALNKLINIGRGYAKKYNKKKKKIVNQWDTFLQCIYWCRLDELEKHPEYNKLNLYDGYHAISRWEYTNIIKKNILSCISHFLTLLNIEKNKDLLREITDTYTDIINNKHTEIKNIRKLNGNIYINENNIIYKNFSFKLDDRINFLIKLTSARQTLRMLLRYSGLGIDGSHCALPSELYNHFYDKYNVRGEGYSSPLNSKLVEKNGAKICTAFYDTDKCFGGVGRFNRNVLIQNSNHNWAVNPPYIEKIIEYSFREIEASFDKINNQDFLVIYLILKRDDDLYDEICNYKYVQSYIEPPIGEHYMNCNGKLVHMGNNTINSMFLISKNPKYKNWDFSDIMKIWNNDQNNPKKNQSLFQNPTVINNNIDLSNYKIIKDDNMAISIDTNTPKSIRKFIENEAKEFKKQVGGMCDYNSLNICDVYKKKYAKYMRKITQCLATNNGT